MKKFLFIGLLFLWSCNKQDKISTNPKTSTNTSTENKLTTKTGANGGSIEQYYLIYSSRNSKKSARTESLSPAICNISNNLCFEGFDVWRVSDGNCTGEYMLSLYISVKSEVVPSVNYCDIYLADGSGILNLSNRGSLYLIDNSSTPSLYKYRYDMSFNEINLTPCGFVGMEQKIHFNFNVTNNGINEIAYYGDPIMVVPNNITGIKYFFTAISTPNTNSIILQTDPGICISQNCYFNYGPGTFYYEYRPITNPQSNWTTVSVTPFSNTVSITSLPAGSYEVRGRLQNMNPGLYQFTYSAYHYYPFPLVVN